MCCRSICTLTGMQWLQRCVNMWLAHKIPITNSVNDWLNIVCSLLLMCKIIICFYEPNLWWNILFSSDHNTIMNSWAGDSEERAGTLEIKHVIRHFGQPVCVQWGKIAKLAPTLLGGMEKGAGEGNPDQHAFRKSHSQCYYNYSTCFHKRWFEWPSDWLGPKPRPSSVLYSLPLIWVLSQRCCPDLRSLSLSHCSQTGEL